ncbi:MAG: ATP-binding protein [Bacteroidales bacterium]|nr:ATP-binding protein [Bacteroidales bacterium]
MADSIKILLLEDVKSDVFLIERQLKKNKINYILKVIDNKSEFKNDFKNFNPDILISDFYLPDFTGIDALLFLKKSNINIPFIIVTGALDEETAVNCIKAGADDYLTKEKLSRLGNAVKSVLEKRKALIEKEKALKQTKLLAKELQTIIHTVNVPIITIDINGRIIDWNKTCEKITGFSKKEVLNKIFVNNFIYESEKEKFSEIINNALSGLRIKDIEISLKIPQGIKKLLLNITTQKNSSQKIIGLIFIGQDITEIILHRDKLERQVKERTERLKTALNKEKELVELKSRFVSVASHEFRTPLTAIGFASGFLRKYYEKIDYDTVIKKLTKIDNQTHYMTELLDDMLTIGKSEAKESLNCKNIQFNDFIRSLIEEILSVTKNSHKIFTKFSDNNIIIESDNFLLRKIFLNLMTNAVKFSPGKEQVLFECKKQKETLICSITDFGIGIPKDECENIFVPFRRGTNTGAIQGTGLGLLIVKDSVQSLGGTISVKSKLNIETVFTVKLPLSSKKINNLL